VLGWLPTAAVRTEIESPFGQRREGSCFCFLRYVLSVWLLAYCDLRFM